MEVTLDQVASLAISVAEKQRQCGQMLQAIASTLEDTLRSLALLKQRLECLEGRPAEVDFTTSAELIQALTARPTFDGIVIFDSRSCFDHVGLKGLQVMAPDGMEQCRIKQLAEAGFCILCEHDNEDDP